MKKDLEFKAIEFDPFALRGELLRSAPATEGQTEIWTSLVMSPIATLAYNESLAVKLAIALDQLRLQSAIDLLIQKHDALRMSFSPTGRTIFIAKELKLPLRFIDLSNDLMPDRLANWQRLREEATREAFVIDHAPLLRISLVKFSSEDNRILLSAHHLVCDGWSLAVLLRDLAKAYSSGQLDDAPSFADYAMSEHESKDIRSAAYWQNIYRDAGSILELPIAKQRPALRSFESRRTDKSLAPELVKALKDLARRHRVSYVALQLSAFAVLLGRLSDSHDISIGMPSAGQASQGLERLIGHCVHLLPMRIELRAGESFATLLERCKKTLLDAYDHQDFTFGELLKSIKIPRDPSRIPLVSVMFNVDTKLEPSDILFDQCEADYESNPRFAENFELFINISESKKESIIECQYNSTLFTHERIDQILDAYLRLLQSLASEGEKHYDTIPITSSYAKHLSKWNATEKDYPREKSLVDLLRAACIHNGSRIAIEAEDGKLSYSELWDLSGKIRDRLLSKGVQKADRVGLCLNRSTRMIAGLIAILRAGASYVPLDPSFPMDRIDYMIQDAELRTILCEESTKNHLPPGHPILVWESNSEASPSPDISVTANDDAYMIYTSGSTGRPKAVRIGHRAIVNFLLMMTDRLQYKTHARLLAVTTVSFDIAVLEIFMPLLNRGTIVLASESSRKDGFLLAKILESEKIDIMQATPSTWRMLLSLDWKPKPNLTILCGGEAFSPDLRNDLVPSASAVWNLYGPTEATVWVTAKQIRMSDAAISVGRPIANTRIYILDKNRQILPEGIKGEVYIAGDALAQGYWRRPDLDAEKFIKDIDGEARLYQSGDIGRINSDGELEIMGRVDSQIKLRGYRIELGEIEKSMLENPAVRAGTVIVREDSPGNPQLVAFLVWNQGDRTDELRASMGRLLPDYMMPQAFVALDQLPLLPNGKIDRNALPRAENISLPSAKHEIVLETFVGAEGKIAELWKKALGRSSLTSEDDFFLVGGHSLLAIQLLAQINKSFECQLTLRDIFQFPKFKAFAKYVLAQSALSIKAIPLSRDKQLSFGQERMWYVEQLSPGPVHNLPGAWILNGKFDRKTWAGALVALCETHDVFGLSLGLESGAPIRCMKTISQIDCPLIDMSHLQESVAQNKALAEMEEIASKAFELDQAPLIKFMIYKIADEKHIVFINAHHMIWDGWSFDLFWSQMNHFYTKALAGELVPQKAMSPNYADYSAWQRSEVEARSASSQYWSEVYKTLPDALDLAIDHPRPARFEAAADSILVPWSKLDRQRFDLQSKQEEATPFMLAMTVLVFTLHRLSGQTDIVIGTPVRGRTRTEFESLLGLFINVLPLRFQIDPNQSFASLLKYVQKVCMDGFAHQDYPFESLLAELKIPRDESRTPLFTAMFSYQDLSDRIEEMPGIKIEQIFVGSHGVPTDFVFWMKKSEGKLEMGIDFRSHLWNRNSLQSFAEIYKCLQSQSAENPLLPLKAFSILPAEQIPRIKPSTLNTWTGPEETTLCDALWKALSKHSRSRVRSGHDSFSYEGITRKASAIASELIRRGVKTGDTIGLCCDRSIEVIQGMLGIMLSGAAYVPFDPHTPRDRLRSMSEQADLSFVVTQEDWLDILPHKSSACLIVSEIKALDDEAFAVFAERRVRVAATDPAYVIFTSGSTGSPKAVQVSHGAAIHFLEGIQKSLQLKTDDVCLALTTLSFDISVLEIFGALLQGASIILADASYAADGDALARLLRDERISFMQATPSGYRILLDSSWTGSATLQAISGGEALPRDLLDRLLPRVGRLWNAYGPTEATVWATLEEMRADDAITIGRPLPGYETFILNDKLELQAIGVWGELYIGGPSLADGYLKDDAKTKARFLSHSLSKTGRLYATGDIVRLRSDGRLEFKARLDTQVKLRGHRIELEEIEAIVSKDSRIRSAAAKVWEEGPGDQRLVLYFVSEEPLTMADLLLTFRSFLPKYMWPGHIERLSTFPLTPSGKLDRRALPKPNFSSSRATSKSIRRPESAGEKALAAIWEDLLHINDPGLDDNFFDLGGHSLLTLKMLARVNESFGKRLKLRDVLTTTLGQLASLLNEEERS